MRRPLLVGLIGAYFLAAGVYLCSVAAMFLLAPRSIPALNGAPFVRLLKLVSPYVTLMIGAAWYCVGWGLLRLKDWARVTAMIFLALGAAWAIPMIFLREPHFGWRMLAVGLEIGLRSAAAVYLLLPSVIEMFERPPRLKSAP